MLIQLKFTCNTAILDIVNNNTETIIFIVYLFIVYLLYNIIVDLRSLGLLQNQARHNATKPKQVLQI